MTNGKLGFCRPSIKPPKTPEYLPSHASPGTWFALVLVAMADMESDSQSLSQDLEEIRQVELPNIDETQIVDGLDEEVSR